MTINQIRLFHFSGRQTRYQRLKYRDHIGILRYAALSLPVSELHAHRSSLPCPAHDSKRVHGTKADVDPAFPLVPKLGRTLKCCKLKTHFSASKSPIHMELRRFLLWKSSCKGNLVSPDATPHRRKTTRFHTLFGLDQPSCSLDKTQPNDFKRMP